MLFQVGLEAESESETTYKKVLTMLPTGQRVLEDAYSGIEEIMKEFSKYVKVCITHVCLGLSIQQVHF